ncbi:MAG: hypothetical protein ACYSU1_05735 [Planctomycetota bacterium]|jgi:hypothetical protein
MNALLVVIIAFALVALGYAAWQAEQKRREQFRAWASERGWNYDHRNNATLRHRYGFLDRLQIGHSRRASHHVHGEWQGYPATAFCFRYTTGSGKHQQTHFLGVALVNLERPFRELRVYPENMLSRFGQFLGYDDIDFESIEFSNAFTVRSADKKFAYDFCNTDMMSLLLSSPSTAMELEGHTLALFVNRYLKPGDLEPMFEHLLKIRTCMPDYLFRT